MVNCAFGIDAWNRELLGEFSVLSAAIGVSDRLVSASVRMHRKRLAVCEEFRANFFVVSSSSGEDEVSLA